MEDEDGAELSNLRGYKKTADGKTTSYFHTEISAEAKALIEEAGFGKPQKLDVDPAEKSSAPSTGAVGSAWNQAGTFEERSYTKWFEERVRAAFPSGVAVEGPISVSLEIDEISGDASIACARGRFVCCIVQSK